MYLKKKGSYHLFKSIQQSEAFFWPSGWNLHSVAFSLFSSLFRCLPSSSCARQAWHPPKRIPPNHEINWDQPQLIVGRSFTCPKKNLPRQWPNSMSWKQIKPAKKVPVPFPRRQPHDCSRLISAEHNRQQIPPNPEIEKPKRHCCWEFADHLGWKWTQRLLGSQFEETTIFMYTIWLISFISLITSTRLTRQWKNWFRIHFLV